MGVILSGCKNELEPERIPGWSKETFDRYYAECQTMLQDKPDLQALDKRLVCECGLQVLNEKKTPEELERSSANPSEMRGLLEQEVSGCYERYLR
jgi:hypothetical protein